MKFPAFRWPLVPRTLHDEVVADLRAQLADERRRTAKLMRTVVKMKVAGGSIPRSIDVARNGLHLEPKQPDAIDAALDANPRTLRDMALRGRHRAWAEREIARDASQRDAVLLKLRTWGVVSANADDDADDDLIAVVR